MVNQTLIPSSPTGAACVTTTSGMDTFQIIDPMNQRPEMESGSKWAPKHHSEPAVNILRQSQNEMMIKRAQQDSLHFGDLSQDSRTMLIALAASGPTEPSLRSHLLILGSEDFRRGVNFFLENSNDAQSINMLRGLLAGVAVTDWVDHVSRFLSPPPPPSDARYAGDVIPPDVFIQNSRLFIVGLNVHRSFIDGHPELWWQPLPSTISEDDKATFLAAVTSLEAVKSAANACGLEI